MKNRKKSGEKKSKYGDIEKAKALTGILSC